MQQLTPEMIYTAIVLKSGTIAQKFYHGPFNDYTPLNSAGVPSVEEIGEHQIAEIKSRMPITPELQRIANTLTKDIMTAPTAEEDIEIEKAIEKIEAALDYTKDGSAAQLSQKYAGMSMDSLMTQFETLKSRLAYVCTLIYATGKALDGTQLYKEVKRIEEMYESINGVLDSYKTDGDIGAGLPKETVGYLKAASWLGKRLKGKYLEVVGTQWIADKLIDNIKVVNVGKITGPTIDILGGMSGSGKMIRTDIMAFDLTKHIDITFTVKGETHGPMPLADFLAYVEQYGETETINLDADNLTRLQSALIAGVQAKAGKGQAVFNPKPVSVNQAIATEGGAMGNALAMLVQLVAEDRWSHPYTIKATSEYYDAMFNYCLAKGLHNIIGKENNLVLTRSGIQTMRDYLIEQWEKGRKYVQAKGRAHLDKPDAGVMVVYSGAK